MRAGGFGPDAHLNIAAGRALGAQPSAGEVGAAEVHDAGIDHDGLGVQAGAAADGEVGGEFATEFEEGGGAGGAGVENANFDTALGEAAEDPHDGFGAAQAFGNEHGFEIGGHDVEADGGAGDALLDDFGEVAFVDDQFGRADGEGGEHFELVIGKRAGGFWHEELIGGFA